MVSVLASSVVDRGFEHWSGQRLECGKSWVRALVGSTPRVW